MTFGTALGRHGTTGELAHEVRKALTAISAGWNVEHAPDGTHAFPTGRWTPVLGGEDGTIGQTYIAQNGRYIKLGALVVASYRVALSVKGTITGNAQLQGLPYAAASNLGVYDNNAGHVVYWGNLTTAVVAINHYMVPGGTFAYLAGIVAAVTTTPAVFTTADIANTTDLIGSITYFTED